MNKASAKGSSHQQSWSIRHAVLDDAPAILAIFQACEQFPRHQDHIRLIDVIDWLESATDRHPMLVLECQQNIIAWCSIEVFYGLPAFDTACEISLYVMPTWQGQGVGKCLFHHLEKQREPLGFSHLIAYIYASNLTSQGFFKRQGFEEWGVLPNIAQSDDVKEDVYLLGREF